jgi:hypothetical protein
MRATLEGLMTSGSYLQSSSWRVPPSKLTIFPQRGPELRQRRQRDFSVYMIPSVTGSMDTRPLRFDVVPRRGGLQGPCPQ